MTLNLDISKWYEIIWRSYLYPKKTYFSLTITFNNFCHTRITDHFATPAKSTLAVLFYSIYFCVMTSTAAQQFAAVNPSWCCIATPSYCTKWTCFLICNTEVRRIFGIHEVLFGMRFCLGYDWFTVIPRYDLERPIIMVKKPCSNLSKRRHFVPACAKRTRPWISRGICTQVACIS